MLKKTKCINIFEENKEKQDLYIYGVFVILLITFIQISSNVFRYTQLNRFVSSQKNNNSSNYTQTIKAEDTLQFNIIFEEIKEVCSVIGIENLNSMILNKDRIEIKGSCSNNVSSLEKLRNRPGVSSFNVDLIEDIDGKYVFEASYRLSK